LKGRGEGRRNILQAALASLASAWVFPGCTEAPLPLPRVEPPPPPPLVITSLEGLLPLAGLRWIVLARPSDITSIPWLIPSIASFVPETRFNRFAASVGIDLRQTREALVASYATDEGEALVEIVRHKGDPRGIERLFRDRISAELVRSVDRPDLVRMSGRVGKSAHAFAAMGADVVCFQQSGSLKRGPCRIAALLAEDKLKKTAKLGTDESLRALDTRLGPAPVRFFAPGPFEGELARGVRGLAAAATALGAVARPSAREGIFVTFALTGDFSTSGEPASRELSAAWDDLAKGSFGHLLGLDKPVTPPLSTFAADAVSLSVELDPKKLAKGLADATTNEIEAIMR